MTNTTANTNNASFGVHDLRIMLNLIDVVSARGAIKPTEMSAVGELHNKLSSFLSTVDQQAAAAAATAPDGTNVTTNEQGE